MHLQLEVSSLWAFPDLYWLLLSCRKAFQGFNCRHPVSVCASLIPKCPGTEALFVCCPWAGVTAPRLSGASQGFPGVCRVCGSALPRPPWAELFACSAVVLGAASGSDAAIPIGREGQDVRAEFINPPRVQLLVGSWEWEVFVCPKNSYPEERIIKAAPFGSVSKMASSSGYSW